MDNKVIGEKIKKLRKQKRITITDLARLVNMSKSTVSSWENGQRRPELEELYKLANLFDKPIVYFLENCEQNSVTIIGEDGTYKKYTLNVEQLKFLQSLLDAMS